MAIRFSDRRYAGRKLAHALHGYSGHKDIGAGPAPGRRSRGP